METQLRFHNLFAILAFVCFFIAAATVGMADKTTVAIAALGGFISLVLWLWARGRYYG